MANLDAKSVRAIFAEVESATLDAWDALARDCGVSDYARKVWGHEMQTQTAELRADSRSPIFPRRGERRGA